MLIGCRSCGGRTLARRSSTSATTPLADRLVAQPETDGPQSRTFPLRRRLLPATARWCSSTTRSRRKCCSADDYLYLLVVLASVCCEHSPRQRAGPDRATAGLGPQSLVVELASNDGYLLTQLRRARHPGPRHRSGAKDRPTGGRAGRRSHLERVLQRAIGRGLRRGTRPRRRHHRQQRAGPCRRHQRLRGRHRRSCWPTTASRRSRCRMSGTWSITRVRHDLPRAPLLFLADGARHLMRRHGLVPQRRRALADPRRVAAHLRRPR